MFRKEMTSRRYLTALLCPGMSITLSPMSQRGVIGPNPFNVGRNPTSPESNTVSWQIGNVLPVRSKRTVWNIGVNEKAGMYLCALPQ